MSQELVIITLSMPILFALHNLEEVIIFEYFFQKNNQRIIDSFPKRFRNRVCQMASGHTGGSFSLAITILLIILTVISYLALYLNSHYIWLIWLVATLVFTFQLVVHVVTAIVWRSYAFGTITAILFLPIFCVMINHFLMLQSFAIAEIVVASLVIGIVTYAGGIPLFFNVIMRWFERRFEVKGGIDE